MTLTIIPDAIRAQTLVTVTPSDSVRATVRLMTERRIGAVPVVGPDGALVGIFTERDVMCRVVDRDLDPATTPVGQVMTASPKTATPDWPILKALEHMADGGYRHLPVVDNGKLLAIVSIRDLYAAVTGKLEDDILALSSGML
ncbi:Predicted signal-transduction protein containing CBS domains [alpha proteobacterium BAL199]|jgi:CBS domain-containing protein|nr:Predicted signal-transduction protein containing CBS domains [alpha proteobacterium BAL199]